MRRLICALLLASGTAFAQEPESEPEPDPVADAYQEGARLASEGRWAEAADRFRAAIAVRDSATARFNLAQAERNVGRLATAKREFSRARELAEREALADVLRLAESALAALEPRVPKLLLRAPENAPELEARIDGKQVPSSGTIELDPGPHDLVVTARGEEPFVRRIVAREGQRHVVTVRFERKAPPPSAPARKVSVSETRSAGAPVGPILLVGVGTAALTSAALLHLHRNEKLEEAGRACTRTDEGFSCPSTLRSDAQHQELRDDADRAEVARNVLLGVGVGAWTAGVLWWVLGEEKTSAERPISAAVTPSTGGASARVRILF